MGTQRKLIRFRKKWEIKGYSDSSEDKHFRERARLLNGKRAVFTLCFAHGTSEHGCQGFSQRRCKERSGINNGKNIALEISFFRCMMLKIETYIFPQFPL